MSMIQFLIDNNYSIPRFCYHGLLSIAGNCRVCIIDDKELKTSISCAICYESYRVESFNSNAIVGIYVKNALRVRESIFEFLLLSHPLDCPICDRGGECELQDMTNSFGIDRSRIKDIKNNMFDKLFNALISSHMNRCIVCGRCIRFLREIVHSFELGMLGRGSVTEVSSYISNVNSVYNLYTSNIIDLCPVIFSGGPLNGYIKIHKKKIDHHDIIISIMCYVSTLVLLKYIELKHKKKVELFFKNYRAYNMRRYIRFRSFRRLINRMDYVFLKLLIKKEMDNINWRKKKK